MTRKKSIKEEEENPLKPVTESTYFKLPFKFDRFSYLRRYGNLKKINI